MKFIFNEGYFKFLSFGRFTFGSFSFQSETTDEKVLNRTWWHLIAGGIFAREFQCFEEFPPATLASKIQKIKFKHKWFLSLYNQCIKGQWKQYFLDLSFLAIEVNISKPKFFERSVGP